MSFFSRMNAKLDVGWKMTDINCSTCKFNILLDPKTQFLYCPKCDLEIKEKVEIRFEKQEENAEDDDPDQQDAKDLREFFSKPSQSDQVSKKLSEKLLQGWAMLEECCPDCLVPIMRDKKGYKLCVGCNNSHDKQVQAKESTNKKAQQQQQQQQQPQTLSNQQQQGPLHIVNPPTLTNNNSVVLQGVNEIAQNSLKSIALGQQRIVEYYCSKLQAAIEDGDEKQIVEISDRLCHLSREQEKLIQISKN